jgi:excisionase family DNA binding protein
MFKEYPEMLTPKEAMEALGGCKNTMYRLLNTGKIKATRVGGKIWRISRKSLSDYAKTQTLFL